VELNSQTKRLIARF